MTGRGKGHGQCEARHSASGRVHQGGQEGCARGGGQEDSVHGGGQEGPVHGGGQGVEERPVQSHVMLYMYLS